MIIDVSEREKGDIINALNFQIIKNLDEADYAHETKYLQREQMYRDKAKSLKELINKLR